jgi:hypothetical protein
MADGLVFQVVTRVHIAAQVFINARRSTESLTRLTKTTSR